MRKHAAAETLAFLDHLYGRCEDGDGDIVLVNPEKNSRLGTFPLTRLYDASGSLVP